MGDRFVTGKLGTVYLTSDGSAGGIPARARVENQELFASGRLINTRTALDFTIHALVSDRGVRSNEFFVVLEFCPEPVLGLIVGLLDAVLGALSSVRVTLDHLVDFDVEALPLLQDRKLFTFESRSGGIAKNVRFRFVSISAGGA